MTEDYINGFKDGFMSGIDAKQNYKIQIFGMEVTKILSILEDYAKAHESETPNIPLGFTFKWSERKEINEFFKTIAKQGYEIKKCP